MKDLYHNLLAVTTINADTYKSDTAGAGVDLQGYEGAVVIFNVGQSGDTLSSSVYFELKIQESDDGTTFSDVGSSDMLGSTVKVDSANDDEQVYMIGYIGKKRYIKAVIDFTGTHTNGTPISATVIKGVPRHAPTQ